jgi:F420-non-reducing hydrogenase iron-sulfur subunit
MFEPRIVCFFCKWCTYAGADLAGTSRKQYPPNGVVVRVNCTGRIDPQHVLWAFREGADGVLVGGCHPGDCHYEEGNYKTMRRVTFLKRMLEDMGVEPERLHLEWISAAEGEKLVHVMSDFVNEIRTMGPLDLGITDRTTAEKAAAAVGAAKGADKPKAKPASKRKAGAKTK